MNDSTSIGLILLGVGMAGATLCAVAAALEDPGLRSRRDRWVGRAFGCALVWSVGLVLLVLGGGPS